MNGDLKVYPTNCTSAYCGKTNCGGCPRKPELDKFKAWVSDHAAIVEDPAWCPNVYTAQK